MWTAQFIIELPQQRPRLWRGCLSQSSLLVLFYCIAKMITVILVDLPIKLV